MSRDSNGNYSLPSGNPVISGSIIDTGWANPTMADVAAALTDSLSRTGKGGMQAPFKNADGAVGTPGITWANEPTTGFFRKAPGIVGYAVIGVEIFTISSGGITINPNVFITQPDGATGNQLVNANDAYDIAVDVLTQGGVNYLPLTGGAMIGYTNSPDGAGDGQLINKRDVAALIAAAVAAIPPSVITGTVVDYAGATPPAGYLVCDGSPISRTTYVNLFNAIGTIWGSGDGINTFNLPNLQRRTTIGVGGIPTPTIGASVGNVGGAETHTLIEAEMPAHVHSILVSSGSSFGQPAGGSPQINTAGSTSSAGGNGAHNNVQPSAVMNKIIKI